MDVSDSFFFYDLPYGYGESSEVPMLVHGVNYCYSFSYCSFKFLMQSWFLFFFAGNAEEFDAFFSAEFNRLLRKKLRQSDTIVGTEKK